MNGIFRMKFAPGEAYIPPVWLSSSNAVMFGLTGILCFAFFIAVLKTLCPLVFRKELAGKSRDLDASPRL